MRLGRIAHSTRAPPLGALALPLLLVIVPGSASAAEPPAAALRYETPRECPARHEWVQRLHERLPPSPATHAAADALRVRIEQRPIGSTGREYHGVVKANDGEEGRTVRGTSCREVFEALVLVAVLSLSAGQDEAGDSASSVDVTPAEPASVVDGPAAGERVRGGDRVRWGAAGLVLVQSGVAPSPSLDVGGAVVARWSLAGFEPWLLLGAYTGVAGQTVRVEGASARFEHAALRAVGCPWRYPGPQWLALRPCLGLDVGRSRGEGIGFSGASSNSSLWLAARGEVRLEFSIDEGLSLGGAGGAALPLVRPRFYFERGGVVFETPAWGLEASGFVAWLF